MRDLGTLGGNESVAFAVNASGQIAGSSQVASGKVHGFLWEAGTMRDLGTLGGDASVPGVPDTAIDWTSQVRDFTPSYSATSVFNPLPLPGRRILNDAGQVVGTSLTAEGWQHPFLWQAGTMRDLGTLGGLNGLAVAINSVGLVVGNSALSATMDPIGGLHTFLYEPGRCP